MTDTQKFGVRFAPDRGGQHPCMSAVSSPWKLAAPDVAAGRGTFWRGAMTDLPAGPFSLIYADPPWQFKVRAISRDLQKTPDRHYPTMSADDLMSMPVAAIAAPDAFLAMWVYDPMLPDALKVADAWGFTFTTVLFRWLKGDGQGRLFDDGERLPMGLGYHTRGGGCEECWLFKRGKGLPVLRHDIRKEFYSTRREHSRKPDEARGWLVDLYGDVPRLEMFARSTAPGWTVWGNETRKFRGAA